MKKFPRTPHLPFSPGCTNDDKRLDNCDHLLNVPIIITEKLDGGNCCIHDGKVYARSHAAEANHPSFDIVKNWLSNNKDKLNSRWHYYFENMYAIHSIEYEKLNSFMYLLKITDSNNNFIDGIECEIRKILIPGVPVICSGHFVNIIELENFINKCMEDPSEFGGPKEGVVISIDKYFKYEDYSKTVAKYVRADHVQTDEHWSKNWRKATIIK